MGPIATPCVVWPPTPSPCAAENIGFPISLPQFILEPAYMDGSSNQMLACNSWTAMGTSSEVSDVSGSQDVVFGGMQGEFHVNNAMSSFVINQAADGRRAKIEERGRMGAAEACLSSTSTTVGSSDDEEVSGSEPVLGSSLGSALHASGKCSPCAWFWKPNGCQLGSNCNFCHLCGKGELNARKKAKIAAMRAGIIEPLRKQGNQRCTRSAFR